jgi:hypothetical protein
MTLAVGRLYISRCPPNSNEDVYNKVSQHMITWFQCSMKGDTSRDKVTRRNLFD